MRHQLGIGKRQSPDSFRDSQLPRVWHYQTMTFRKGADYSRRSRTTSGGRRRGGTIAAGGGLGSLVLIGLYLLLGGDPAQLDDMLGGGGGATSDSANGNQPAPQQNDPADPGAAGGDALARCDSVEDANTDVECRTMFTASSLDDVWAQVLPEQAGIQYQAPGQVLFQDQVQTGCGAASAATGPFYCPTDQTAYFDTSFFSQLESLGGTNAPFAQMYIVAHEFGHHIQQLEGTLGLSNYNDPGADSNAVKIELQADCYAGLWANHSTQGAEAYLEPITQEQLATAVESARAVGDDNIQRRSGGEVRPEQFTHGTSQQRQEAFLTGYNEGTMAACDLLERGVYSS